MNRFSLPSSIALLVVLGSTAWGLECPIPASLDAPADATRISQILPADTDLDAPDALQSAVFDLRAAGISDDQIINSLIAVYCAAVSAQPGVSDEDKSQRVEAFSQSASQAVLADVD